MYFRRLTALRREVGLTQQQAADLLHCRREVYRRYETGGRDIPVWVVIALAKYYGVTTDYILELSPERPEKLIPSLNKDED